MAKGGGGIGDSSSFTGGMMSAVPSGGITPSSAAPGPAYTNFLGGLGAGQAATPQNITAAYNAAPQPPPQAAAPPVDINQLRQMLAGMMGGGGYAPPRDINPGSSFSPFGASSNSGGGYQSHGGQAMQGFRMPSTQSRGGR